MSEAILLTKMTLTVIRGSSRAVRVDREELVSILDCVGGCRVGLGVSGVIRPCLLVLMLRVVRMPVHEGDVYGQDGGQGSSTSTGSGSEETVPLDATSQVLRRSSLDAIRMV